MRLRETTGDSWDSARLMETHETQGDYWGIRGLMRLRKTTVDLGDSGRLLGTHETQRLLGTYESHDTNKD